MPPSPDDTGILITPADPKARRRDATRVPTAGGFGRRLRRVLPWALGAVLLLGGAGYGAHVVLADSGSAVGDPVALARADAEAQRRVAADATARALALEAELDVARAALAEHKITNEKLASEKAKLEAKAAEAAALEQKLAEALGDGGSVTRDGDEITLELVDKVLFRLGDDQLTPRGEVVMYRVGEALAKLEDKQIWVQGHTDKTPIRAPKGVTPRFASNWELSAARALTVVHYLEDEAKLDPRRLAAVAFGEHRPASRNKAKNRRIEIVLYPKHTVARR